MRPSKNRSQQTRGMTKPHILPAESPQVDPAQQPAPPARPAPRPVKVTVAHGNLAFCNDPVAVGHYEGDPIVSAEKALDTHLKRKLSDRHRLSRYPGPEGTAAVILNDAGKKPGGAIIVGLGKAGELSPRKLTLAFANAMREYCIVLAENGRLPEEGEPAVSTLLIGAGGMGLSVANSVDAILNGVLQANNSFSQMEGPLQQARIARVQFIELYKDQAILATRALRRYEDKPEFDVKPRRLQPLRGGFQRLFYEEPPGWWSRIYVRAGSDDSLIFMLPTDRARAEESHQGMQKDTIEGLISQAVKNPRWDENLASSMFELMIPNRLKGSFRDLDNVLLVLDPEAAHYPWELIHDRRAGQDEPLVIQFGLIRQFSTGTFQQRVVDVKNRNVVVIGNPDHENTGFKDLPGAEQEAGLVAAKFKDFDYDVVDLLRADSTSIMNSLFAHDYRVLHLAAHGVYRHVVRRGENKPPKEYTGVVIGKDIFLTANEIQNKMDIPELVFINCCHLGTLDTPAGYTRPEYNKLAASLSEELIKMGVKAVIAAGWAVDDTAALTFASAFYDHLLTGATFGEAVKAARRETYRLHKDRTNTWAAYQCYGDPNYRLTATKADSTSTPDRFVDLDEAVMEIRRLSGKAKTASVEGIPSLREGLLNLRQRIKDECSEWLEDSGLQEALGEAFGELYLFEDAIKNYELALNNRKCAASVKAFEQLANIRTRRAVQLVNQNPERPESYEEAKKLINQQIEALKSLMRTVCETPERWSLIGGAYKRLALISYNRSPETADEALEEMEHAYREAGGKEQNDLYALSNRLAARLLRLLSSNNREKIDNELQELRALAQQALQMAEAEERKRPDDFWASIGHADASLIDYLVKYLEPGEKEPPEAQFKALAEKYGDAWRRYGSAREISSVIDQYAFLAAVLEGAEPHRELAVQVKTILDSLEALAK